MGGRGSAGGIQGEQTSHRGSPPSHRGRLHGLTFKETTSRDMTSPPLLSAPPPPTPRAEERKSHGNISGVTENPSEAGQSGPEPS